MASFVDTTYYLTSPIMKPLNLTLKLPEPFLLNKPRKDILFIGVTGGSSSGKKECCTRIVSELSDSRVVVISQQDFYKELSDEDRKCPDDYNFHHPLSFDYELLVDTLTKIKEGTTISLPVFDFTTYRRSNQNRSICTPDVVILEGILIFYDPRITELMNLKIFVDADSDVRLLRHLRSGDSKLESYDKLLHRYERFMKPSFDDFTLPTKRHADIIIPRWPNDVAVDLVVQHAASKLEVSDLRRIHPNLRILRANFQVRGLHTIIRDSTVSRSDFVFYSDRIIRLLTEDALGMVPFKNVLVETPTGEGYNGVEFSNKVCGVSIVRAGEAMEGGLRAVCKNIRLGKILLKRLGSDRNEKPKVLYHKLPEDISDRFVLLLDPILATGESVTSAIELLLLKGVRQDKIIFMTLIAAAQGIHAVCTRYPSVKVLTSEIDDSLDDNNFVMPGIGDFGDRYFGTE